MVLTYNMVLSRLDTLNQREQEVRKFYKPMPKVDQDPTKPFPHRHRFADVLEPGDVVRTIDKSGEDGGGGDENIEEGQSPRGDQVGRLPTSIAAQQLNDLRQNRPLGPGRESQRHVTQTAKKERQLRKAIDGELKQRTESLKSRLYREAGITQDGEKGPKDDVIDIIDPLFKQVGKATMTYPKPLVQKTGSATSMEIKISEPIPRFAGGPGPYRHASEQGAILAPAEQEQAQAEGEMPEEGESLSRLQSADSQRSDTSGRPLRPASSAGKSVRLAMPEDENQSATNDEAEMAHLFQGPVSTWTYRKSVYSEHDDPDRREFYFTQLTLPPSELELDPAENAYIVHIQGISLRDRPVHVCKAAGVNDQGKLMFLRGAETDAAMASSILSTADELPWVTDPTQLKGQQLKISIYRRKTTSTTTATTTTTTTSQTQDGDTFVSERLVTFRASQLEARPAIPPYPHPPTSAPQGARDYGRTAGIAAAAPHRPDTAPAISPSKSWSDSKLGSMRSPDTSFSASGGLGRGVGLGGGGLRRVSKTSTSTRRLLRAGMRGQRAATL